MFVSQNSILIHSFGTPWINGIQFSRFLILNTLINYSWRKTNTSIVFGKSIRILKSIIVKIELRLHHIKVTTLKHRKINKTLILRRHCTAVPIPIIGIKGFVCLYKYRIESKYTAIKFSWRCTVSIAAQHITKELIITTHLPLLAVAF